MTGNERMYEDRDLSKIAALWSTYTGKCFTREDVGEMLMLSSMVSGRNDKSADNSETEIKVLPVSIEFGLKIIQMGEVAPLGRYYFDNGVEFFGLKNVDGDLNVETFLTEDCCIAWLRDEFDEEDAE